MQKYLIMLCVIVESISYTGNLYLCNNTSKLVTISYRLSSSQGSEVYTKDMLPGTYKFLMSLHDDGGEPSGITYTVWKEHPNNTMAVVSRDTDPFCEYDTGSLRGYQYYKKSVSYNPQEAILANRREFVKKSIALSNVYMTYQSSHTCIILKEHPHLRDPQRRYYNMVDTQVPRRCARSYSGGVVYTMNPSRENTIWRKC